MSEFLRNTISRRTVLAAGAASAGLLAMPSILRAQDKSLKIGVYGGYFKESFDKNIFPEFTKATGIAVESIAEPTGEAWLVQLEQASKAGQAPADVSMMSQTSTLKGQATELWTPIDTAKIKHYGDLLEHFVNKYPDGRVAGIGAVAWYITLVTNTDVYKEAPTSWAALWDPANKDKLGLLALASNSFLLEVTAKTFMGGTNALDTEEGLLKAFEKLAEVKPNVRLWYRDEAQFEQALKSGEIPMGQYYHDVTGLAAADGHPVRSTFPKEGGIQDFRQLGAVARFDQGRRSACLHRLYEPTVGPGAHVSQGRHSADAQERRSRPHARGVRGGVVGYRADHPPLRSLYNQSGLDQSEVDRAHRGRLERDAPMEPVLPAYLYV